jgi:hypothetical protein
MSKSSSVGYCLKPVPLIRPTSCRFKVVKMGIFKPERSSHLRPDDHGVVDNTEDKRNPVFSSLSDYREMLLGLTLDRGKKRHRQGPASHTNPQGPRTHFFVPWLMCRYSTIFLRIWGLIAAKSVISHAMYTRKMLFDKRVSRTPPGLSTRTYLSPHRTSPILTRNVKESLR